MLFFLAIIKIVDKTQKSKRRYTFCTSVSPMLFLVMISNFMQLVLPNCICGYFYRRNWVKISCQIFLPEIENNVSLTSPPQQGMLSLTFLSMTYFLIAFTISYSKNIFFRKKQFPKKGPGRRQCGDCVYIGF